jgi:predicted MFS family arabinose efflux permease
MNFIRNTIAVIVGLGIAGLIITLGIRAFPQWVNFDAFAPFEHWQRFLQSKQNDRAFFGFLLFISGLGTTVGGVATAIIVKYAKVAYAILIGFIMLFIAMLDVIVFPYHPTFYKISIFLTFFPFSWIGGKIVEVIYERKKKRRIAEKMNKS